MINTTNILGNIMKMIIPKIFNIIATLFLGFFIIKLIDRLVVKWLNNSKINPLLHGIIKQIVQIFFYVIMFGYIFSILEIPQTSMITVLGTIGLALSLSIKDTVSDVASGLIILINKYFEIGDYIEIGVSKGIVTKITLAYVQLTTPDKTNIFIPNSTITKSNVYNYSGKPYRRLDERFVVGNYRGIEDTKEMISKIIESSNMVEKGAEDKEPRIYVESYTEENTTYLVKVWVDHKNFVKMSYYLNEEIKKELEEIKSTKRDESI